MARLEAELGLCSTCYEFSSLQHSINVLVHDLLDALEFVPQSLQLVVATTLGFLVVLLDLVDLGTCRGSRISFASSNAVEPPNKGHLGVNHFVLC